MKTIYSIRTSLGRELWWTTGRKKALDLAAEIKEPGDYITDAGKAGGTVTPKGLRKDELPIDVYRCSIIRAKTPEEPARPLSERRAADRETMATKLIEACKTAGATASRFNAGDRQIVAEITVPGGATILVDFDGRSVQPDVFVQTWNLERPAYDAGVRLRDWEGCATAKRNTVARGFDQLVSMLVSDITAFISGDGYWQ